MLPAGEGVTHGEAAEILGCSCSTVQRLIACGLLQRHGRHRHRRLDRRQVEELAAQRWVRPRQDENPDLRSVYWVTSTEAAELMGVSRARVGQLAAEGRLPHVVCANGDRIFRRAQIEVISNARIARQLAQCG